MGSLDDIAYELQQIRRDGIQFQADVDASFNVETEHVILALASHFIGNHEMCDHDKPQPESKPEEEMIMAAGEGHVVITVDVQQVTYVEKRAGMDQAGPTTERVVNEMGRFSVQAEDIDAAREKASKMLEAI